MRKLVFVTQQVDPGHPALAATVPKLRALARRVDELVVIADGAVPGSLPENCRVRLFASGWRAGRGVRFETALTRELRPRASAVVAHMCPIYAVLAAPLVRPLGIPVVLWYTHWHASRTLRLAETMSTSVASVDRRSFPLPSEKVHAIGHGIDLDEFVCRRPPDGDGLRVLSLGRYSPAKGLDVVLHAARQTLDAGIDIRLQMYGPVLSELERNHRAFLEDVAHELGLDGRATLGGPVPRTQVPELLAANDVLVNNMRAGAPDKVVYEAAAGCVPTLASNPVFDTLLPDELRFEREDPGDLARRLSAFAKTGRGERAQLGRALREKVARDHSVDHWAEAILELAS